VEVLGVDDEDPSYESFDQAYQRDPEGIYTKLHQLIMGAQTELAAKDSELAAAAALEDQRMTQIELLTEERDNYKDAFAAMSLQQHGRSTSRGSTPAGTESKKSTKIADPEPLSNGKEPTFEQWKLRMDNKLEANHDHYPTESLRIAYIMDRTKGDAARHVTPRMKKDHPEAYKTAEEVFTHLAEVYEDPEKQQKAKNEFRTLKMENGHDFQRFRTDFLHLAGEAKIAKDDYQSEFFSKLSDEMKPLVAAHKSISDFKAFVLVCTQVAPTLAAARSTNKKASDNKKKVGWTGTTTRGAAAPASESPRLPTEVFEKMKQEGRCYHCKELGHMRHQCPLKKATEEKKKLAALAEFEATETTVSEASKNE
jgi:hypothetical protein